MPLPSMERPPAEPGYIYFAGLDLGLKRDASALVLIGLHVGYTEETHKPAKQLSLLAQSMVDAGLWEAPNVEPDITEHPGTGRLKVCDARVWTPKPGVKLDIEPIERAILDMDKHYRLSAFGYDPWQSEYLSERLRTTGLPVVPVTFVPGNLQSMAQAVLEAFNQRLIDLYNCKPLLDDLRALRVAERGYGIRLESPRGPSGHGDCVTALAIALHLSRIRQGFTLLKPSDTLLVY